jgi:protocatechuate 3,4-dioxygenase beta subunit
MVRPEQTEGPYFVDEELNRSDIRTDPSDGSVRDGTPLQLTFKVTKVSGTDCIPLIGAIVDIWHCDAEGQYSDVNDGGQGFNTTGKKFLRGYQTTDANGRVQFTTIYPGWYQGRTVHIHFKIREDLTSATAWEFTSQLYFNDTLTDQVHAQQPYAARGQRDTRNSADGIYSSGGDRLLLSLAPSGSGYAGAFDIAMQV